MGVGRCRSRGLRWVRAPEATARPRNITFIAVVDQGTGGFYESEVFSVMALCEVRIPMAGESPPAVLLPNLSEMRSFAHGAVYYDTHAPATSTKTFDFGDVVFTANMAIPRAPTGSTLVHQTLSSLAFDRQDYRANPGVALSVYGSISVLKAYLTEVHPWKPPGAPHRHSRAGGHHPHRRLHAPTLHGSPHKPRPPGPHLYHPTLPQRPTPGAHDAHQPKRHLRGRAPMDISPFVPGPLTRGHVRRRGLTSRGVLGVPP